MKKSFVLRIDAGTFSKLKSHAGRCETSINAVCTSFIERGLIDSLTPNKDPAVDKAKSVYGKNLVGVVLFGSAARGTQRETSDVDYLIVLSDLIQIKGKLYRAWDDVNTNDQLANASPHFVHLPKDAQKAGSLWLEVAMEGRILMDTDFMIERHVSALRRCIAEGVFERSYVYGVPYWRKAA